MAARPGLTLASRQIARGSDPKENDMGDATRQQAFDREFRGLIERHRPALVSALREIIAVPTPDEVKIVWFEIQPYWDQFPVYLHAMDDASPDETYYEAPFCEALLEDAGRLIPDGAIDQDGYEDAEIDTLKRGAETLARWFGECWHEAGGGEFSLPSYISRHDDSSYYDLRTLRWVEESDIWP